MKATAVEIACQAIQQSDNTAMITPVASCVILATGGAVDAVKTLSEGHGLLAEIGLPMEAQLGISALFLGGFCYAAKLVLQYHKERVDELKLEKAELVKRLREIQEAREKRIEELEERR